MQQRSDLSPSGIMSGLDERESPYRYPENQQHRYQGAQPELHPSKRPSQITSKSRITNHTKYQGNNESYDQVVMFKSDGFDNSKQRHHQGGPPQGHYNNYTGEGQEEFNTSRFTEVVPQPNRASNVDQSSSALVDEDPYSGKQNVTNPFAQTTPQQVPGSTIRPSAGQFIDQNNSYEQVPAGAYRHPAHGYGHQSSGKKQGDTSYTYTL